MYFKNLITFTVCLSICKIVVTSNEKEPVTKNKFVSNGNGIPAIQKREPVGETETRSAEGNRNDDHNVIPFRQDGGEAKISTRGGLGFFLRTARRIFPSLFFNHLSCDALKNFPSNIELESVPFKNWAQMIQVESLRTAHPKSANDVVQIANWAAKNEYTVRPRGFKHSSSPLVVSQNQTSCGNTILVDTTKYLTSMRMVTTSPLATVQVETGASLENLLTFLENMGFGIRSHPAPGDVTIGGMLAVSAHGSGIQVDGHEGSYGSISNLVTSLDAIVWNKSTQSFEIKTFDRSDPEAKAFLTNLGRIFITQVSLRVIPAFNMRCVSRTDIPASEMFADPRTADSSTRTFSKLLQEYGSVETILFPFTTVPWTKIWSVSPKKPFSSLHVSHPFNYPFSDSFNEANSNLAESMLTGRWRLTPTFGDLALLVTAAGLQRVQDIWGPSKNVQLYVKSSTFRIAANGYAVLTNRGNIQEVISRFYAFYENLVQEYATKDVFPVNGPLEIRVSGLDNPHDVGIPNAESPTISALKPIEGRPDLDTAIWFDCITFPTTPFANQFMKSIESFLFNHFDPSLAIPRPEWSKGWAYTDSSPWTDQEMIRQTIPELYNSGANGNDWNFAIAIYNKYDPARVFTNPFLNSLLQIRP